MKNFLRVAISCIFLVYIGGIRPIEAQRDISIRLEKELNKQKDSDFTSLMSKGNAEKIESKHKRFLDLFPNAKWVIKSKRLLADNKSIVEINITGQRQAGEHKFSLESKQKIELKTKNNRIIDQKLISEYAMLSSGEKKLGILLKIPDEVLTGTEYDADIIFEKPLDEAILAGGMAMVSQEEIRKQISPIIELEPIMGGGLFKSIKAPLNTGNQYIAALITHPDGIISVTKTVKVVTEKSKYSLNKGN